MSLPMPCPDSTGLQLGTRLLGWPHMCRGAHHRNGHKCGKELCIRKLTADTAPFITLLPPLFLISCVASWFHLLFYASINVTNFTPHNIHHFLRPLHSACYAMHCLFGLHVTVLDRKEIRNNNNKCTQFTPIYQLHTVNWKLHHSFRFSCIYC